MGVTIISRETLADLIDSLNAVSHEISRLADETLDKGYAEWSKDLTDQWYHIDMEIVLELEKALKAQSTIVKENHD